jgi:predicted O-methyltransferase YrrM
MAAIRKSSEPFRDTADGSRSQTLARGLEVLEVLAEAKDPLSIAELGSAAGTRSSCPVGAEPNRAGPR